MELDQCLRPTICQFLGLGTDLPLLLSNSGYYCKDVCTGQEGCLDKILFQRPQLRSAFLWILSDRTHEMW